MLQLAGSSIKRRLVRPSRPKAVSLPHDVYAEQNGCFRRHLCVSEMEEEATMKYPRFAKYAAIATLSLVVLGAIACGSTASTSNGRGSTTSETVAQPDVDEGLAEIGR